MWARWSRRRMRRPWFPEHATGVAGQPQLVWLECHAEQASGSGAVSILGNSQRHVIGARFAELAHVRDRFTMRLLSLFLTLALGAACADAPHSPTSPDAPSLPPAVNLTGTWRGQYVEVGCQSATCPVCCTSRGKIERRRGLTLVMTQDAATVTGVWDRSHGRGLGHARRHVQRHRQRDLAHTGRRPVPGVGQWLATTSRAAEKRVVG